MSTIRYNSGTAWEREVHYSRALRRGRHVYVSGTTAMDGDELIGLGDAGAQAAFVFDNIERSLQAVGARLADVVRTRMYLVDAGDAAAVTAAHGARFAGVEPCATLVVVAALISPELLVEIEVDALLAEDDRDPGVPATS